MFFIYPGKSFALDNTHFLKQFLKTTGFLAFGLEQSQFMALVHRSISVPLFRMQWFKYL